MAMTERPWPDVAGPIEGDVHLLPIRVYYEDTDFSGAVYHANYLKFCERGRSDWLRLLHVHHRALDRQDAAFVVRRMDCEFLKPARIDDLLEVETRLREAAGARMELDQRVARTSEVIFRAKVTVALVGAGGRPKRLPRELLAVFASSARRTQPAP